MIVFEEWRFHHMTKQVVEEKEKKRLFRLLFLPLLALLLLSLGVFVFTNTASAANSHQTKSSQGQVSQWTPTGKLWKLTVTFVTLGQGFQGSRDGQVESSLMTFLPGGRLTATFPGASPDTPPTLPPAIDGAWFMTGPSAFHYRFKDPILAGGKLVAYVQVQINASLVSPTAYVAGGVGVAYSVATGLPIPGQYNVTSTVAIAA
jgi:hypothetical protein